MVQGVSQSDRSQLSVHVPWSMIVWRNISHLQLPDNGLAEVLGAGVRSKRDKIASVDVFLPHTALTFLLSSDAFSFETSSLSFLSRLPPLIRSIFSAGSIGGSGCSEAKQVEVGPAKAALPSRAGTIARV